jgi:8-oxo-dGTP diphosphatase
MPKTKRPNLSLAVDFVLLSLAPDKEKGLEVLLLKRPEDPHKGTWTLPGAFVHLGEDRNLRKAIDRILKEKVRIPLGKQDWENQQLGCFYSMERDNRNVATVVYWGLISRSNAKKFKEGSANSEGLKFSPVGDYKNLGGKEELPFDHAEILKKAIEHLSETMERKSTATKFFEKELTTRDLRLAYETVWSYSDEQGEIDATNFAQFLKKQTQAFSLYQLGTTFTEQTTFNQNVQQGRPALNWIRDLDVLEDKKLEYPLPRKPRRSKPKKS